jgi:hypothetical protein
MARRSGESFAEWEARDTSDIANIQRKTIRRQLSGTGREGDIARQRYSQQYGSQGLAHITGRTQEDITSGLGRDTSTDVTWKATGGGDQRTGAQITADKQADDIGGPFEGFSRNAITKFRDLLARGQFNQAGMEAAMRELVQSGDMPVSGPGSMMSAGDLDFDAIRQTWRPYQQGAGTGTGSGAVAGDDSAGRVEEQNTAITDLTTQLADLQAKNDAQQQQISNISTSQTTAALPSPPATGNVGIRTEDSKAIQSLSEQVQNLVNQQKEGYSNEDIRREQQQLVSGLGKDAETAGRDVLNQLNVPEFERSPLEGALESRFLDDLRAPTARDVGIGDVGGQLEELLRARLTGGFEQDAIGKAAQQRFATESSSRREALAAELAGLGVLRGGGNTIDSFGRFDAGISQGISDIDAQTQQRRDADLARAQQFAQFQSGLGLSNRQLGQQDLAQSLGFEQSQSDRTQRQREFEFGANATRLDMQQSVADRTLARLLTQTEPTQRERFEEGVRQTQTAEALGQSRFGLESRQYMEDIRRFDKDLALRQEGLRSQDELAQARLAQEAGQFTSSLGETTAERQQRGNLARLGLSEQEAARLQQESQYGRSLTEQQAQFSVGNYLQNQQFKAQLAQQESQYGRTLQEEQAQWGQGLGFQRDELAQQQGQFTAAQGQQALQFGRDANLRETQQRAQEDQWGRDLQERQAQFGQTLGLQRDQLEQQQGQFETDEAFRQRQMQLQDAQFTQAQYQQQGQFESDEAFRTRQLGQQQSQFVDTMGFQRDQLAQQQGQFETDAEFQRRQLQQQDAQFTQAQYQQQGQFESDAAFRTRQLAQQQSQFVDTQGLANRQLAQQESQYGRSLTETAAARAQQNAQFAAAQYLQNQQFGLTRGDQVDQFGRSLAQQQGQFADDLHLRQLQVAQQQGQFESDAAFRQRQLTQQDAQFAQSQYQQAGQFGQSLAEQQAARAQQARQYGRTTNLAERTQREANVLDNLRISQQGSQFADTRFDQRQQFEADLGLRRFTSQEDRNLRAQDVQFQQGQQKMAYLQQLLGESDFTGTPDRINTMEEKRRYGNIQAQILELLQQQGINIRPLDNTRTPAEGG